jgi:hypothetical protein
MPLDPNRVREVVTAGYSKLPHPDVPELTNGEFPLYERVAAMMSNPEDPSHEEIRSAYHQLTQAGISPQQWEHAWQIARPLANRLLDRDPDLSELVHLIDAHPADIHHYYSSLPSPSHPEIQAGELARYLHVAAEPAGRHLQRGPLLAEAARFAAFNASPEDVELHYQRRASSGVRNQ